jgi:hypothetical protein
MKEEVICIKIDPKHHHLFTLNKSYFVNIAKSNLDRRILKDDINWGRLIYDRDDLIIWGKNIFQQKASFRKNRIKELLE